MPNKSNKDLKTKSGVYKSQLKASAKYTGEVNPCIPQSDIADIKANAKVESVRLRVPKGQKNLIEKRAKDLNKSINKYICDLIDNDLNSNAL